MLVAKISFYFESAKKTGEKFQKKLGFQNRCTRPCHPQNRHHGTMKGLYATFSSWHIDLVVSREVRGNRCIISS